MGVARVKSFVILLSTAALLPTQLFPWGGEGHQIVALIAERNLKPSARAMVTELLGDANISDAEVVSWADEIKRDERRDTADWHYVNIPMTADTFDRRRDGRRGENVIDKLTEQSRVLADESQPREKRAEALKWVVHLAGDVHQPLHVADRNQDRGGNSCLVFFLELRRAESLHKVWDTWLVREIIARPVGCRRRRRGGQGHQRRAAQGVGGGDTRDVGERGAPRGGRESLRRRAVGRAAAETRCGLRAGEVAGGHGAAQVRRGEAGDGAERCVEVANRGAAEMSRAGREPAEDVLRRICAACMDAGLEITKRMNARCPGWEYRFVGAGAALPGWRHKRAPVWVQSVVAFSGDVHELRVFCTASNGDPAREIWVATTVANAFMELDELPRALPLILREREAVMKMLAEGQREPLPGLHWTWRVPNIEGVS
jgi:hypothetical protein